MYKFLDVLICEIKKRPLLWDKKFKHDHYGNRKKVTEEWQNVATILNKSIDEVKTKWRNLKDTFHREEKKMQMSVIEEGKPLISYYTGQWDKFEKLLFIYNTRCHTRSNEEYWDANTSELCVDDIKVEFDVSENSNDNDNDPLLEEEQQNIMTLNDNGGNSKEAIDESNKALENDLNSGKSQNNGGLETSRKRALDDTSEGVPNKKRTVESIAIDVDIDEHMLVNSLVPFLKKLNPIRKLIVRNELQNLLLKELLCDQCRVTGLQPNCRCNLN